MMLRKESTWLAPVHEREEQYVLLSWRSPADLFRKVVIFKFGPDSH